MAGTAGYTTKIRISGTATAMTSEAMSTLPLSTASTLSNIYQVTSTARRVFQRSSTATFTFTEASTATTSGRANISSTAIADINYLFGRVRFKGARSTPIRVTGQYMPVATVGGANTYTLTQTNEMLDDTDYDTTGVRSRFPSLRDISLTISRWEPSSVDHLFFKPAQAREAKLMEVRPGNSTAFARGWFLVDTDNHSGDVTALEQADVTLQIDHSTRAGFAWADENF